MELNKVSQRVKLITKVTSSRWFELGLTAAAGLALSLILYPAAWNLALGGLLEKVVPTPIYNAVHELRHLWGIPCH
ncbi:MAG: hypothetical protein QXK71_05485 [Pyrobaculum sp.]|jgi:hypothetical protein|uniref:CbtB-domain containing protein n=1 Tax=Pyrobaculum aerophilum TaxID=13773 RepID=A0A832WGA9_9CREN|nr:MULTISPECIES: hypothetical protein [Pyrobaculum]MCX8136666.1 CbtB-domain containing protein [Pyrobaculum aerophilum]HII46918.1 CbtB-domain containing protein [Pyrobaculum aerophilum]